MKYALGILGIAIIGVIFAFGVSSLIFWGLGNLIIWVFKINYTWTIWHGLVCGLVYSVLKEIFSK